MRHGGFMWVNPGGRHFVCSTDREGNRQERIAESVALYRERGVTLLTPAELEQLRGHDLVCWCPLGQPCHADVLLELANA
ncbi:hypothetical protein AWB94_04795 [Mycolicibacterium canariasense]|nr:hypothetical protein AWB94_04795 [Mycolicibacterium canariasense]